MTPRPARSARGIIAPGCWSRQQRISRPIGTGRRTPGIPAAGSAGLLPESVSLLLRDVPAGSHDKLSEDLPPHSNSAAKVRTVPRGSSCGARAVAHTGCAAQGTNPAPPDAPKRVPGPAQREPERSGSAHSLNPARLWAPPPRAPRAGDTTARDEPGRRAKKAAPTRSELVVRIPRGGRRNRAGMSRDPVQSRRVTRSAGSADCRRCGASRTIHAAKAESRRSPDRDAIGANASSDPQPPAPGTDQRRPEARGGGRRSSARGSWHSPRGARVSRPEREPCSGDTKTSEVASRVAGGTDFP